MAKQSTIPKLMTQPSARKPT